MGTLGGADSCVTRMIVFCSVVLQFAQQIEDLVGALGVEIAGRLVGDDQRRDR